jgi:prepilin-type N-terminal cleavage/methylation domain-containing protein
VRKGFTLLEVMMVIGIGLIVVLIAVPSVQGFFASRQLEESFERFDRMAVEARALSLAERRPHRLEWGKGAILLRPDNPRDEEDARPRETLAVEGDDEFAIDFPAALAKPDAPLWTFWPSGACEPAVVTFKGKAGSWTARYDAIAARGRIESMEVR